MAIFGHILVYKETRQIVWAIYDLINNKTISALQFLHHGHLDLQKKKKKTQTGVKKKPHGAFHYLNYVITAGFCCHHQQQPAFFISISFFLNKY